MRKTSAYPLRLESAFEAEMEVVADQTGLPKTRILRMSIETGFAAIDWSAYKKIGIKLKPGVIVSSKMEEVEAALDAAVLNDAAKAPPPDQAGMPVARVLYRSNRRRGKRR